MEQFIFVVTGKQFPEERFETTFRRHLRQTKDRTDIFKSQEVASELMDLMMSYMLIEQRVPVDHRKRLKWSVYRIQFADDEMKIRPGLEEVFREAVEEFDCVIHSTLLYLVEDGGELNFRQISHSFMHGEYIRDDYLASLEVLIKHADMFIRHFAKDKFTDEQAAEISKYLLVTSGMEAS
jgi:hypothetical protein